MNPESRAQTAVSEMWSSDGTILVHSYASGACADIRDARSRKVLTNLYHAVSTRESQSDQPTLMRTWFSLPAACARPPPTTRSRSRKDEVLRTGVRWHLPSHVMSGVRSTYGDSVAHQKRAG